nr:hypothetical protein [Nesterenkonia salmonea]
MLPLVRTWYQPPRELSTSTLVPADKVRATLLLMLGPDLMFTPDVTRAPLDEEDELFEPDDDEPEDEPEDEEPDEEELPEPEDPELDEPELDEPELEEPDETLRYSPHTQPVLPLARTRYQPPRCSSTVTDVPAESTRSTRPLMLGPDLMFTPEVTRAPLDEDDELFEPEELLAGEELLELDELFDPEEPLEPDDEPEELVLRKSCHTQPVLPLTRT